MTSSDIQVSGSVTSAAPAAGQVQSAPSSLLMGGVAARLRGRLLRVATERWFHVASLVLLVTEVQWRLWDSLDLPQIDEAWALLDGFRLARGDPGIRIVWWDSPLYTLMYALSSLATRSVGGAFYTQRFLLSLLSVLALYFLFRRLLPSGLAWAGAAWWAVSPFLVDLNFDRTDFLAASTCTWTALAILAPHSADRIVLALALAVAALFFHPSFAAIVFGLLLYLAARFAYSRLNLKRTPRLLLIGLGTVVLFAVGSLAVAAFFSRQADVGSYFVWVFANNRSWSPRNMPPYEHLGLWPMFERDFGPEHSINAILSHRASLARDTLLNTAELIRMIKQVTTATTWGVISLQFTRWLFAMLAIAVAAIVLCISGRKRGRGRYAAVYGARWLDLLPLLAYVPVLLFFWPLAAYVIVIIPMIIGSLLFAYFVIVQRAPLNGWKFSAIAIAVVLLLAPTPRSFYGAQPIRHVVAFFEDPNNATTPLRILGQSAITICPYLVAAGQECEGDKWDDEQGARTLASFTDAKDYEYFVYDTNMNYARLQPSGIQEVLTGQNPQWREVAEIGDYRIFRRTASP